MKVIICAIARNEGKYIKDFCEYHLQLGFDEIHVYDNGTEIPITDSRIVIHPFMDVNHTSPQMLAYNEMLHNGSFDWCAFIDIDEFMTISGYTDIHDYINYISDDEDSISMIERVYGDSGLIIPEDISVPVYERLTLPSKNPIGKYVKHIVRKNIDNYMLNPHILLPRDSHKNIKISGPSDSCYLRHYKTKTLSEFCDQKLNTPRVFNQLAYRRISYYFTENEKTEEKLEYLRNRRIQHD